MSRPQPSSAPASRWPEVLAWSLCALITLILVVIVWFDRLLRASGRAELSLLRPSDVPYVLSVLSATAIGLILARRRPRHPVGWLLLVFGLSVAMTGLGNGYARYGLLAAPGSLPGAPYAAMYTGGVLLILFACVGTILLRTPSGALPSRGWRWWVRVAVAAPVVFLVSQTFAARPLDPQFEWVANPLAVPALAGPMLVAAAASNVASVLALLVAAGSVVVRFRRASGLERYQLRWLALAAGVATAVGVVVVALSVLGDADLIVGAVGFFTAVMPLAIGAAVLRYRLYDLDRIISRTLAYALLTVLLGAGYAGVVLGLGQVLGQGRDDSSLAVAGATLAVAVAFQPARRRIQDLVDRRFNRRRYDAERTIAAFRGRLRQQTDLDALTTELLAVVDQTMQPARAALWLRPAGRASTSQGGPR